jgi:flagellar biosynthetic protein FlhB
MADESSSGEKTEKASAKKLKDAREKGQVVRSRDLVVAMASLAITLALASLGGSMMARLAARVGGGLARIGDKPLATVSPNDVATMVLGDLGLLAIVAGPLLVTAAIVAVAGNVAQSGWVFSTQNLQLNVGRLSPAQGLARLKPSQSWVDLLKQMVSVTAIAVLAVRVVTEVVSDSPRLMWMAPPETARTGWQHLLSLLWRVGFALLALAGADYGLQFWRLRSSLKMTKQEQKDETRSAEGSPELKARVRKVQREMNKRRMLKAVKGATVVVTNPTHYAVALEYRRDRMSAPIVVAKGKDLMAQRIKAIARDSGVPIVENVSLAQALFKGSEVGDAIPGPLFGAVAEVLAYLVRIKQLML